VGLDLEHLGASFGKDKIVVAGRLGSQDHVANDRGMRGLIEHLAVMFLGIRAEPRQLVYGLTGREQQSETKKQQITGHLLNLRIHERFRMLCIRLVCPECSRQAPRFKPSATEQLDETGWLSVAKGTSENTGRCQHPAQIVLVLVVVLVLDIRAALSLVCDPSDDWTGPLIS
jgi:hypothetical protein